MKRIHLSLDVASPRIVIDGGMHKSTKEFSGDSLRDRVKMSSRAPKTVTSQEPHSDRRRACQILTDAKTSSLQFNGHFLRTAKSTAGQALHHSPTVLLAPMQCRMYTAPASARYLNQDPSKFVLHPTSHTRKQHREFVSDARAAGW
jgi:hypothetical protein